MNVTSTTSQQQDLPLPVGADPEEAGDWQVNDDGGHYRHVWSRLADLPEGISDLSIQCVVVQLDDGSIVSDGEDGPEVYVGTTSYTPDAAILVANAIIKAAFQAVRWSGGAK